jgi:hypothetical protein
MKRILLITLVIGLFAVQANAGPYYMDAATAAGMRQLSISSGDIGTLYYVGYNPGILANRTFGTYSSYGSTMFLDVGFTGNLVDDNQSDSAIARIGLINLDGWGNALSLGLSGIYDSFRLPISNDNDDVWRYQAYVTVGNTTIPTYVSGWTTLIEDTQTSLLVSFGGNLDFSTVTGIGFEIEWKPSLNDRDSDEYHTSVVPAPAAVILAILGLGAVGLKLRKYA